MDTHASGPLPVDVVIFFDWDDTFFPSTFLASKGYRLDTPTERLRDLREPLRELEVCVADVLRLALNFGNVIIVTNAEKGWVQLSAEVSLTLFLLCCFPHATHTTHDPPLFFFFFFFC